MSHCSARTAMPPADALLPARLAEFEHWTSPAAVAAIERERIALQPMSRILGTTSANPKHTQAALPRSAPMRCPT
jgi:hypothetical protein